MNEPAITTSGNLTAEPELTFTNDGRARVRISIAANSRYRDSAGEWQDGTTTFLNAEAWGAFAENLAESLRKGDRVLVTGRLRTNVWTPDNGPRQGQEQRAVFVAIDDIGPSLRYATASPTKTRAATNTAEQPA